MSLGILSFAEVNLTMPFVTSDFTYTPNTFETPSEIFSKSVGDNEPICFLNRDLSIERN